MTPLEKATADWAKLERDMPDWIRVLAIECGRTSQAQVARALGRSGSVVSQVLRGIYGAETTRIEERVRGLYMDGRVECPALGEITSITCQDWRDKAQVFTPGSPRRAQMYRFCIRCPRNRKDPQKEVTE